MMRQRAGLLCNWPAHDVIILYSVQQQLPPRRLADCPGELPHLRLRRLHRVRHAGGAR